MSPSEEVHTIMWTPKFAAPEVREKYGRLQTVRSDIFAWAATIRAVSRKDEPTEALLESILEECSATDPQLRPKSFSEIARRLEQPSYVMWGKELQGSQQWLEGERLSNSNRTAVEAVTLLAEERKVWRQGIVSACSSKEVSEAYFFLSLAHSRAAKPAGAVKALQKSVVWHPKFAWHPALLANLGNAYGCLGDAFKHRDFLERALPVLERHYGQDHPEVAKTLANLGTAYGSLGDPSKKRIYLERALRKLEDHYMYGPEHPDVSKTLMNLGNAYGALGDASKQRDYLERALKIALKHYGQEHPDVALVLMSLGNAYGSLGDAFTQRDCLERALPILESHYGQEHPEIAKTLANLGNTYGAFGDAVKQRDYLERALRIKESHYGPGHPEVAKTLTNLGSAYGSLRDAANKRDCLEFWLQVSALAPSLPRVHWYPVAPPLQSSSHC
eukprot:2701267-Amphidinium_carterae.1